MMEDMSESCSWKSQGSNRGGHGSMSEFRLGRRALARGVRGVQSKVMSAVVVVISGVVRGSVEGVWAGDMPTNLTGRAAAYVEGDGHRSMVCGSDADSGDESSGGVGVDGGGGVLWLGGGDAPVGLGASWAGRVLRAEGPGGGGACSGSHSSGTLGRVSSWSEGEFETVR